jgi:hypothetical protein
VPWDEVQLSLRDDAFDLDDELFVASELYCVDPDCDCTQSVVMFDTDEDYNPGCMVFAGNAWVAEPLEEDDRPILTALWEAYCARHPDRERRFAERRALMHAAASRITPAPVGKVGRNDPCPCGSGKKYKKCCAN